MTLFCPKCGSILMPKVDGTKTRLHCSCGYSSKEKADVIIREKITVEKKDKIDVVDKKIETDPKTEAKCPKCGNKEAYYWLVQTRAGDEAETQFFKCTKCSHQWRNYT